jgi:4'-phosphopantetheinyl transferase
MREASYTGQDGVASSLSMLQAAATVTWAIAVKCATPRESELHLQWLPHPDFPALAGGPGPRGIAFWLAAVSPPGQGCVDAPTALLLDRAAAVIDAQENDRLTRLLHDEDRRSYLAAHAGARLILGHVIGRPADALQFKPSANGKPVLLPRLAEVDFSLSHARGAVAVAVARMPIGVDVEPLRDVEHLDSMSELALAAEEQAVLRKTPRGLRSRLFLRYWTLKEALLKAAGLGFTVSPSKVIIDAGPAPTVLSVPAALGSAADWRLVAPSGS